MGNTIEFSDSEIKILGHALRIIRGGAFGRACDVRAMKESNAKIEAADREVEFIEQLQRKLVIV